MSEKGLALVTGASSGIGTEFARQLGQLGFDLIITARRKERLESLASELASQFSVQVHVMESDLSQLDSVEKLVSQMNEKGLSPNVLVNNAGAGLYGELNDFDWNSQRSTIFLNVLAPTELIHRLLPSMRSRKKAYILNVSSIGAFHPVGNFAVYSATKSYLRFFSEAVRLELGDSDVGVTCVCPGGTITEFFESSGQEITRSGQLAMMSARDVVAGSLKAMFRGQSIYIPGVINKLACFLPRFLPDSWTRKIANMILSKAATKTQIEAR